jgi:CMP-N-acetylneuraminic acid synthetase
MLKDRAILGVVPARGGSKGVPLKNIHPLAGKPLLLHTADVIRAVGWFDLAVVSTDHPAIADVARSGGLEAPFMRPPELSGDRIGDYEVLVHALTEAERVANRQFDVVVMLQPTSPLRTADQVRRTITALVESDADAAWTVSPTPLKYHPLKQLCIQPAGRLSLFDDRGRQVIARQQLEPVYHRNGVAYAFTRGCLLELGTILPPRTEAVVLDGTFVSIDTLEDFAEVEAAIGLRHTSR